MPTVLEDTSVSLERTDLFKRSPIHKPVSRIGRCVESTRAQGMHLSGVLRYVAQTTGLMKVVADIDEEELPLRMALGFAWEEFAVSLYPEVDWQPGERVVDGIAMNCDGMTHNEQYGTQLEEFKLTWKKVKTASELMQEQWYWMQQGRGYCWGYESNLVRWHVCFVNGDYRGSGPVYKKLLVHFTHQEIEKTRTMIFKNLDAAREMGHAE